jgi:hypothetical protein
VLDAGTHTLSVEFKPTNAQNYNCASASVTIVVSKATPNVTWSNPAGIAYGTALSSTQLNATANVPGTFDYFPPAGTVLSAGTHTLSVTFTPADTTNYNNANGSQSIVVSTRALTITANPASKVFGEACRRSRSAAADS